MEIQKQVLPSHAITAYQDDGVKINGQFYRTNILVSANNIVDPWSPEDACPEACEILIIGHDKENWHLSLALRQDLMARRIGLEIMGIGAACRTFNLLLSEGRQVYLALIFI